MPSFFFLFDIFPSHVSQYPIFIRPNYIRIILIDLSVSRIKKIISADPALPHISASATFTLALATQLFIQHLARASHTVVLTERSSSNAKPRRNIQYRDVATAVSRKDELEFLSDVVPRMTTWGQVRRKRAAKEREGKEEGKGGADGEVNVIRDEIGSVGRSSVERNGEDENEMEVDGAEGGDDQQEGDDDEEEEQEQEREHEKEVVKDSEAEEEEEEEEEEEDPAAMQLEMESRSRRKRGSGGRGA